MYKCVYVCVCWGSAHILWRSEDNSIVSLVSFHFYVGVRDELIFTQSDVFGSALRVEYILKNWNIV